jgi:hypothetical protein
MMLNIPYSLIYKHFFKPSIPIRSNGEKNLINKVITSALNTSFFIKIFYYQKPPLSLSSKINFLLSLTEKMVDPAKKLDPNKLGHLIVQFGYFDSVFEANYKVENKA